MDIKIEMDAQKVQDAVVASIMQSTLGKHVEDAIADKLKQWGAHSYWESGLKKMVAELMEAEVRRAVTETITPTIRERVAAALTPELLNTFVTENIATIQVKRDRY